MPSANRSGMEELRLLVQNFNYCREMFLEQFSVEELIKIHRAHQACGWDIFPDNWHPEQVEAAACRGIVPRWDENERPIL